jgi:hypothetical protein
MPLKLDQKLLVEHQKPVRLVRQQAVRRRARQAEAKK